MKILQILLLGAYALSGLQARASVTITSPANGATVASPFELTASSSGAAVGSISVYVNGSLNFQNQATSSIDTNVVLSPGAYLVRVVARYTNGRTSAAAIRVKVSAITWPGPPITPPTITSTSFADQIAADMQGTNEGYPHGVPLSYDWANGPVVDMGNNSNGQKAITSWGVVYVAAQGSLATNTRVNLRDLQLYFLQKKYEQMAPFAEHEYAGRRGLSGKLSGEFRAR